MGYTPPPSRGGEPPAGGKPEEGPRPKKGKKGQEKFSLPQKRGRPPKQKEDDEDLFGMRKQKETTPSPQGPTGNLGQPEGLGSPSSQNIPSPPPNQGSISGGQPSFGPSTSQGQQSSQSSQSSSQTTEGGQTQNDTQSSQTQRKQDKGSGGQESGQGQAEKIDHSNKIVDAEVADATTKGMDTDVAKITGIIKSLVDKLYTGTIEGKKVTGMELKESKEIPEAFRGTQLTITETDKGLVISFANFSSHTQETQALRLLQDNQSQLTQLVQTLQGKNIQVASIQLGNTTLQVQQLAPGQEGPAYFQQGEGDQQQDQGEQEPEEAEEGPNE